MGIKEILILGQVKGIGPSYIKKNLFRLRQESDFISFVQEVNPTELNNIDIYAGVAKDIIIECNSNDIEMISVLDSSYPQQLLEISDPPSILYLKGNKSLLQNVIAIIGTRQSTDLGNRIAERVGYYFSKQFSICNGLVEGIDQHSIYVNGKPLNNVIGVISGGLCYKETCSSTHVKVIEDVLQAGGLIISEFYPHQKEDMYSGSKASRIQAGLSNALILIQSKEDGGSKYTLAKFSKLGRPIGVIHYPSSEEYKTDIFGANRLIVEKGEEGIAQIVGVKKSSSLNTGPIVTITSKDDYNKIINEVNSKEQSDLFS